jgi:hypothetical protein
LSGPVWLFRFAAIADWFEASDVDAVSFQEVFTYWHLSLLARRMRSFREVSHGQPTYLSDHIGLSAKLALVPS